MAVTISSDPWQHIAASVNGKHADGRWGMDAGDLVLTLEWGPGVKQRCEVRLSGPSVLELHYACLAPAAHQLEVRRQLARERL